MGESPTRRNAPAGCNRSNCGGNETVEAFGEAVTKYGDGASVQAVTRVNAEQASKRTMRRLTRICNRGKLIQLGKRADEAPSRCAGVLATACTQGEAHATGEPQGVVEGGQPDAREGRAGRRGVTERLVVRAEQRVVQEGSSPSGARMRSGISESGVNASLAGEGLEKGEGKGEEGGYSLEGRVSTVRWDPKGMRRSTGP